jgi:hypothetical protein
LLGRRGEAFLLFVGEEAAEGLVASYMHVISLNWVVPGVFSMVLMVMLPSMTKRRRMPMTRYFAMPG